MAGTAHADAFVDAPGERAVIDDDVVGLLAADLNRVLRVEFLDEAGPDAGVKEASDDVVRLDVEAGVAERDARARRGLAGDRAKRLSPATRKTMRRGPGVVTASRRLPGPLSASVVTASTAPPRPPGVSVP
jgi:hypothetical protein